jgi:hypothetical protein
VLSLLWNGNRHEADHPGDGWGLKRVEFEANKPGVKESTKLVRGGLR